MIDEVILNYKILSIIGSGSFGTVSRAKHTLTGTCMAVKAINKLIVRSNLFRLKSRF